MSTPFACFEKHQQGRLEGDCDCNGIDFLSLCNMPCVFCDQNHHHCLWITTYIDHHCVRAAPAADTADVMLWCHIPNTTRRHHNHHFFIVSFNFMHATTDERYIFFVCARRVKRYNRCNSIATTYDHITGTPTTTTTTSTNNPPPTT